MTHFSHDAAAINTIKKLISSIIPGSPDTATMSLLVEATAGIPLANLDDWEGVIRWSYANEMYRCHPTFSNAAKHKPVALLTWLDICSASGYTREKLLRSLSGGAPNRFFFALALRRLNDWVVPVRAAARENLFRIAGMTHPEDVAEAVFVTLRDWPSWGRMQDDDRQVLAGIMAIPTVADLLKQRLMSATAGSMSLILGQMGRWNVMDASLEEIATSAVQPALRARAYRSLLAGEMTWIAGRAWVWTDKCYGLRKLEPVIHKRRLDVIPSFEKLMISAARDRSPMVRKVAGEMLIRQPGKVGSHYVRLAKLLAADTSPSVAAQGQFMLRKLEEHPGAS